MHDGAMCLEGCLRRLLEDQLYECQVGTKRLNGCLLLLENPEPLGRMDLPGPYPRAASGTGPLREDSQRVALARPWSVAQSSHGASG
jgi:hypothetical protein